MKLLESCSKTDSSADPFLSDNEPAFSKDPARSLPHRYRHLEDFQGPPPRYIIVRIPTRFPWETVFAITASLLINASLLILIYVAAPSVLETWDFVRAGTNEGGEGVGGNFIVNIKDYNASPALAGNPSPPPAPTGEVSFPEIARLPQAPAAAVIPAAPEVIPIGVSSGASAHVIHIRPTEAPKKTPKIPTGLVIAGPIRKPEVAKAVSTQPAVAVATSAPVGSGDGSKRPGRTGGRNRVGDGEADNDEGVYDIFKEGSGQARGRGRNRGAFGGDKRATVLDSVNPVIPLDLRANLKLRSVYMRVSVSEEGLVSAIEVIQSSGDKDVDAIVLKAYRQYRFRPTLENGRPVADVLTLACQP